MFIFASTSIWQAVAKILRARASEHPSNFCAQFEQRPNFASTFKLIWHGNSVPHGCNHRDCTREARSYRSFTHHWPLPPVWMGVSVCRRCHGVRWTPTCKCWRHSPWRRYTTTTIAREGSLWGRYENDYQTRTFRIAQRWLLCFFIDLGRRFVDFERPPCDAWLVLVDLPLWGP